MNLIWTVMVPGTIAVGVIGCLLWRQHFCEKNSKPCRR
ncbi:hypothetical protein PDR5_35650 [Pseudomonas sp. DR 5-09]|nr:hypothetical protein PDR5_35650 [Pseudomonas sp. DR 5-09]